MLYAAAPTLLIFNQWKNNRTLLCSALENESVKVSRLIRTFLYTWYDAVSIMKPLKKLKNCLATISNFETI